MSDVPSSTKKLPTLALLTMITVSIFIVWHNVAFVENFGSTLAIYLLDGGSGVEMGGTSKAGAATASIEALVEAIARLSYILAAAIVVLVALTVALRRRSLDYHQTVLFVMVGALTTLFLAFDILLNAATLSVSRGIVLMPSVLLLVGVRGFEVRHGVAIILAIGVVTAGVGIIYPSEFTGQVGNTPTGEQVAGVKWLGENRGNATVDGGRSTFWIAEGLFGKDRIRGWAGPPYNPKRIPKDRSANYPWTASQFDNELTIVDSESRSEARHRLTETGNRSGIVTLRQFRSTQSRIYANGGSNIYWWNMT